MVWIFPSFLLVTPFRAGREELAEASAAHIRLKWHSQALLSVVVGCGPHMKLLCCETLVWLSIVSNTLKRGSIVSFSEKPPLILHST